MLILIYKAYEVYGSTNPPREAVCFRKGGFGQDDISWKAAINIHVGEKSAALLVLKALTRQGAVGNGNFVSIHGQTHYSSQAIAPDSVTITITGIGEGE